MELPRMALNLGIIHEGDSSDEEYTCDSDTFEAEFSPLLLNLPYNNE